MIVLNISDLDNAVRASKSGSLSWESKNKSFPSLEAKPWPAKNTIRFVSFFLILLGSHFSITPIELIKLASLSIYNLMFSCFTPKPFFAYS